MNNFKRLLKVYFFFIYLLVCSPKKLGTERLLTKTSKAKKILFEKFEQNIYIIVYIL